jgi:hypothetical protein
MSLLQSQVVDGKVSAKLLSDLIEHYNGVGEYQTSSMNKTSPVFIDRIQPFCEEALGRKLVFCSGNFYKHDKPYLPHTDYKPWEDNTINAVVPLWYEGDQASLVVFDQWWEQNPVTWCLDLPLIHFEVNTGVKGYPCHYELEELTGKECPSDLYKTYLSNHRDCCFFGLSGEAFAFEPGNIILFDNRKVHCTSRFIGKKLGISLRFRWA